MRIALAIVPLLVVAAAPGCKPKAAPCMTMAPSELLKRAAVVRLEVFGADARCASSNRLAAATPPSTPTLIRIAAAGTSFHVDVSAGKHVLLVSAYGDAAAHQLIGTACQEIMAKPDDPVCSNLTLELPPDGGAACQSSADCVATAAPLTCCSNQCVDTANDDILNCGGCGRACLTDAAAGVAAASCSASLCKPTCLPGYKDCTDPAAPLPDDGCETNTNDPMHCGDCGHVCTLDHVQTPTCPSGKCAVAACASGWFDCDGNANNGCECAAITPGGTTGCCPTNPSACGYQHSDGFGHNFVDCIPVGAYSADLAQDAANAFQPGGITVRNGKCSLATGGHVLVFCSGSAASCACFAFGDDFNGNFAGKARRTLPNDMGVVNCTCPLGDSADVTWQ